MNPRQCEFCDKELSPQAEFDVCESCIKVMTVLINEPGVRTIQPDDTWGHCTRCGSFVRNDDIWHENCSRTAELTALEAEIGRAVIANYIVNNSIWALDKDWSFTRATNDAMNILNKCLIVEGAIVGLIARWRQLHAAGAEGKNDDR